MLCYMLDVSAICMQCRLLEGFVCIQGGRGRVFDNALGPGVWGWFGLDAPGPCLRHMIANCCIVSSISSFSSLSAPLASCK